MNVRQDLQMTKAAFLQWSGGEKRQRFELVGGRVVMMPRPSRDHGVIAGNLFALLHAMLRAEPFDVIMEFGLDTLPDTLRYPDVVVCPTSPGRSHTTGTPVLLAEVLSPSNAKDDFDKASEYLRLPTLLCYVVLAQDEPKAWLWSRASPSKAFAAEPEEIAGIEAVIAVAGMGLKLPMVEVYRGVFP